MSDQADVAEVLPVRKRSARYFAYLILLVVTVINLLSYANFSPGAPAAAHDDAVRYLAMSQQTFAPVDNPFALRLLSPAIVNLLQRAGLGLNDSWIVLTFLATLAAVVVFFKIVYDHFRLSLFVSLTTSVMLACTYYFTLFNFEDPWLVDPVNNLAIVVAVYAALEGRLVTFTVVILVGCVNKETMLMFAPLYPLLAWARGESWRSRAVVGGTALIVVVGVAYVGFRWWVQSRLPDGYGYTPLAGAGGHSVVDNVRASVNTLKKEQQLAIFETFHFVWFVFFYGLYRSFQRSGFRNTVVVAGVFSFLACMFGRLFASDVQRVIVMMAPVVFVVAALWFARFNAERYRPWLGVLAVIYVAINLRWVPITASVGFDLLAVAVFVIVTSSARRVSAVSHTCGERFDTCLCVRTANSCVR